MVRLLSSSIFSRGSGSGSSSVGTNNSCRVVWCLLNLKSRLQCGGDGLIFTQCGKPSLPNSNDACVGVGGGGGFLSPTANLNDRSPPVLEKLNNSNPYSCDFVSSRVFAPFFPLTKRSYYPSPASPLKTPIQQRHFLAFSTSSTALFMRPSTSAPPPPPPVNLTSPSIHISNSNSNLGRIRHFSFSASDSRDDDKSTANFVKAVIGRPLSAARSAFFHYQEAIGLQLDAFWKRNSLILLGAGGVLLCALLWRLMFGVASTFVVLSEGMAKYGFFALSAAMVSFSGLYLRSRFTINPDKVYRMAMRRLNTSAGILEVMGAPLSGTDLRAYVISGGGLLLKNFKPVLKSKRCFLIFPIRGSERKGLVSVEVKKKKGQYDMKLLAVDVPMATGHDQRLFLIGDEQEYRVGGGLISELRDPVVRAMAAAKEFEDLDQIEEEQDAERELQEAERKLVENEKFEEGRSMR